MKKTDTIVEAIRSRARDHAGKTAFIEGQRKVTYSELLASVDQTGESLTRLRIEPGSRVAIICEDSIEYVIISLAVLKIRAAIVPVPFASSPEEIESVLNEVRVDALIFQKGTYTRTKAVPFKILPDSDKEFLVYLRPSAGDPPRGFLKMDPAFIRFSSGTTGTRKGVVISHQAILERTAAANKALRISSADTVLWVLSMSFHFVVTILLFLRQGATTVLAGGSFPDGLLNSLQSHKPTFIYASPLHYHVLSRLSSVTPKALSGVRMAISTAMELAPRIAKAFREKFGFELNQAYGIIEIGLPFVNRSHAASKRASVGKILPGYRIKIVKTDKGAAGEIHLKGKGMFSAYFTPWKPAEKVLINGWFNTGDTGTIDKDGFLFILGRTKNVINFNGMKIFPFEVESVLLRYPQIREARVYGIPHPEYGSMPTADVVLEEKQAGSFDEDALRAFCYRHLAKYKVPKEFRIVDSLPKTASGKIVRSTG